MARIINIKEASILAIVFTLLALGFVAGGSSSVIVAQSTQCEIEDVNKANVDDLQEGTMHVAGCSAVF